MGNAWPSSVHASNCFITLPMGQQLLLMPQLIEVYICHLYIEIFTNNVHNNFKAYWNQHRKIMSLESQELFSDKWLQVRGGEGSCFCLLSLMVDMLLLLVLAFSVSRATKLWVGWHLIGNEGGRKTPVSVKLSRWEKITCRIIVGITGGGHFFCVD